MLSLSKHLYRFVAPVQTKWQRCFDKLSMTVLLTQIFLTFNSRHEVVCDEYDLFSGSRPLICLPEFGVVVGVLQ